MDPHGLVLNGLRATLRHSFYPSLYSIDVILQFSLICTFLHNLLLLIYFIYCYSQGSIGKQHC